MMEKLNSSCEPMDVDLSTNSIDKSHNFHNDSEDTEILMKTSSCLENVPTTSQTAWNKKIYHINIKTEKKKSSTIKMLWALLALCASITFYLILDFRCTEELNLTELRNVLKNKVHDQFEAVNNFVDSLSLPVNSKILYLYGSTGVGKTYTISLFLENIWNSSNIYHFTMPSFLYTFSSDNMFGMNVCKTSIIIVDDLKQSDLVSTKEIVLELIKKSENLRKKITIVLILNCDVITKNLVKNCDDQFYREMKTIFEDVHVTQKFIKYERLTQKTLKKCINDLLKGQKIDDQEYNSLLNNFDVTLDGCKSVYKKVKFLKKV